MNRQEMEESPSELDLLLKNIPEDELNEAVMAAKQHKHRRAHSYCSSIPTGPRRTGRHHRNRSSIGQFMMDGLGSIKEGVELEAVLLRDTWQRELEDADQGRTYFLDMSMTRSLSILPETIPDFVEEATGVAVTVDSPKMLGAAGPYLALMAAVLAVSSNGTALAMLDHVAPALKLYWRMSCTWLVLSTFAIRSIAKEGFPDLSKVQWCTFVGACVCYTIHALLLFIAFQFTSIGNAIIGANSQAILLILGKLLVGQSVLAMEGAGVLLAFTGCVLCTTDEAREAAEDANDENDASTAVFGDVMALCSGVFGVGYLTFAKAVRHEMPVTVFMFMNMFCGSFIILAYMLVMGYTVTFSNDPHTGLFGWANTFHDRIFILAYIALVCNVIGTMGFVRAMKYFDNIVIAVATLTEPMIATMIAYALGVGELPGPLGWMGNVMVIFGTLGVVYPAVNKGEMAH